MLVEKVEAGWTVKPCWKFYFQIDMSQRLSPSERWTKNWYRFWWKLIKDIEQAVLIVSNLRDCIANGVFSLNEPLLWAFCEMLDHLSSKVQLVWIYSYVQAPTVVTDWVVTQNPNQSLGLVWLWVWGLAGQTQRFGKQSWPKLQLLARWKELKPFQWLNLTIKL